MKGWETSGDRPLVVGANHRSSSLTVRDRLFVEDANIPAFLNKLQAEGIENAVLLSTCDRVEVIASHSDPRNAAASIKACFADLLGDPGIILEGQCYTLVDDLAVEQIFAVAASLDSQIIGEPQVLGQVKAAHRIARDNGMVGGRLEALMQAAFGVAKRVRTETAIGERPVSIAAAAVDLARDVHGDLSRANGLLIGVGDMGHMVTEHLMTAGLERLTVTHPIEARAAILARHLNCHRISYNDRAKSIADADVVVTALGRRDYALNTDMVQSALKTRRMRPMFLVDVAVPGDVDPAINRIDAAFLYDLADLERIVSDGRASRETEAEAGRNIVAAEVAAYQAGRAGRAAVPAVRLLREHAEQVRADVLAKADGDAEKATRLMLGRLLHDPSVMLRHAASGAPGEFEALDQAIRKLFQLDDDSTGTSAVRRDNET